MKNRIFLLAFFVLFCCLPFKIFASVLINEVAWMGTLNSSNDEWIELFNQGDEDVDLTGWQLSAEDGIPLVDLEGIIGAGDYFLLERTDDDTLPDIIANQIYAGALSNSGEVLVLKNAASEEVDNVGDLAGWLAGDNETKQTMELKFIDGMKIWQTSAEVGGTPKAENSSGAVVSEEDEDITDESVSEEPGGDFDSESAPQGSASSPPEAKILKAEAGDDILILLGNEIVLSAASSTLENIGEVEYIWNLGNGEILEGEEIKYKYQFPGTYIITLTILAEGGELLDSDSLSARIIAGNVFISEFMPNPVGKDSSEEWIEIYNDSPQLVDLSGWKLDDEAEKGSKAFVFPENSFVAPFGFLVLQSSITKISLNNDSDYVRLLFPVEDLVADSVFYEETEEGYSVARLGDNFVLTDQPTPGASNLIFGGNMKFYNGQNPEAFFSGGVLYDFNSSVSLVYPEQEANEVIGETFLKKEDGDAVGDDVAQDEDAGGVENESNVEIAAKYQAGLSGKVIDKDLYGSPINKYDFILLASIFISSGLLVIWWKKMSMKKELQK